MSDTMRDAFMAFLLEPAPELYDASNTDAAYIWQRAWQAAQSQPAPLAPQSVQEIMRLMGPYIEACVKFNNAHRGIIDDALVEAEDAFKPLEAALTALVEKNHELQFSLDGVNASRPAPNMDTMQAIYAKAWSRAADWANRHDLHSDVGSPEYLKDMAIELAEFADAALDGVNAMRRPEWISVDERLPEQRDYPYQVVAIAKKAHGKESCYPGEGIRRVQQDWVIRQWPQNFTHWMTLPPSSTHGIEPEQGGNHG